MSRFTREECVRGGQTSGRLQALRRSGMFASPVFAKLGGQRGGKRSVEVRVLKLDVIDARDIKWLVAGGFSQRKIASWYGVDGKTIRRTLNR